jgi:HAD superfamily hydrolase (TIGR01549 family)
MKKALSEYKTVVVDMDGTLYFRFPVRFCMAMALALRYLFRPARLRELFVLRDYRKLRKERAYADSVDFDDRQVAVLSERYGIEPDEVNAIISRWMQERPLPFVRRFRDRQLIALIERLKQGGARIVVYSDYPVADKMVALGLCADYQFFSGDEEVGCMKPDAKGLIEIFKITGTQARNALFIGDRYLKDGLCAEAAGADFIILSSGKLRRKLNRHSSLYKTGAR